MNAGKRDGMTLPLMGRQDTGSTTLGRQQSNLLKCLTLARERMASFQDFQPNRNPPNLEGLVRFMQMSCIERAMEQLAK